MKAIMLFAFGLAVVYFALKLREMYDNAEKYCQIEKAHKDIYVPSYQELKNKKLPIIQIIDYVINVWRQK